MRRSRLSRPACDQAGKLRHCYPPAYLQQIVASGTVPRIRRKPPQEQRLGMVILAAMHRSQRLRPKVGWCIRVRARQAESPVCAKRGILVAGECI